jgi:hypothetical protein
MAKNSSLLLHATYSQSLLANFARTILYYGFKIPYKKIRETRKLKSFQK